MSKRRRLTPLFLILLGVIFACVALEIAVRALGMDPPSGDPAFFWSDDERFGWYHEPGAEGNYFNPAGEYNAYARVNSAGLIDQEYSTGKPEDSFRILVLGDSFTEGLRLPMDASFHSKLEQHLNEHGEMRVEVINGGVAGWGTDQQLLFYREVGRYYKPDLVLLAFFPANDIMNNTMPLERENFGGLRKPYFLLEDGKLVLHNYPVGSEPDESTPANPEPQPLPTTEPPLDFARPALEHSALYRYLVPRLSVAAPGLARMLANWGLVEAGADVPPDYIPVAYGVYHVPLEDAWEQGWAITDALVGELQQEVEKDGARLAVVLLPAQEQVVDGVWQLMLNVNPAMQGQGWDLDQPNTRIAEVLRSHTIPYLDLLPDFRANRDDSLFYPIDGHWNEQGHALAAERLRAWLSEEFINQ